jgi:hypothetical protein
VSGQIDGQIGGKIGGKYTKITKKTKNIRNQKFWCYCTFLAERDTVIGTPS